MKTETPRTDRATIYLELHSPLFKSVTYVTPEFAKQLESELNAVNEKIMKLYLEAAPDALLRADLKAEGIKTLEDAYVQGFRHGLAELKMRLAEPSNVELTDAGPVTPASRETQSRHSVQ